MRKSYGNLYRKLWFQPIVFYFDSFDIVMKKASLKWFTLIEMLIVIVIIWILAVVLTESYITISKTALKIEQEKNISEESLVLTQIFQSISDESTIDYERYRNENINLKSSWWLTDVLYLTWDIWSGTKISTSWDCLDLTDDFLVEEKDIKDYTWCKLILDQNWKITSLTTPWKVVISNVKFKVIPFDSDDNYFNEGSDVMNKLHQPAFWMFIHLYSPLYQSKWANKIDIPLQLFFNLNL